MQRFERGNLKTYDSGVTCLKRANVIEADMMVMDATEGHIEPWWDTTHLKRCWRAYHLDRGHHRTYLEEFYILLQPALAGLKERLEQCQAPFDNHQEKSLQAR